MNTQVMTQQAEDSDGDASDSAEAMPSSYDWELHANVIDEQHQDMESSGEWEMRVASRSPDPVRPDIVAGDGIRVIMYGTAGTMCEDQESDGRSETREQTVDSVDKDEDVEIFPYRPYCKYCSMFCESSCHGTRPCYYYRC